MVAENDMRQKERHAPRLPFSLSRLAASAPFAGDATEHAFSTRTHTIRRRFRREAAPLISGEARRALRDGPSRVRHAMQTYCADDASDAHAHARHIASDVAAVMRDMRDAPPRLMFR